MHLWSHALPRGATGPQQGLRLPQPPVGSAVRGHQAAGRGARGKDEHPSLDWWAGGVLVGRRPRGQREAGGCRLIGSEWQQLVS